MKSSYFFICPLIAADNCENSGNDDKYYQHRQWWLQKQTYDKQLWQRNTNEDNIDSIAKDTNRYNFDNYDYNAKKDNETILRYKQWLYY